MSWTSMLKALAVVSADPRLGAAGDRVVLTPDDASAIRGVVRDTLAAFRARDAGRAFAACTPALQASLGDGRRLLDVVARTYPALGEPASVVFGGVQLTPDGLGQEVTLTGEDGENHHAVVLVDDHEGSWKVVGCVVLGGLAPVAAAA